MGRWSLPWRQNHLLHSPERLLLQSQIPTQRALGKLTPTTSWKQPWRPVQKSYSGWWTLICVVHGAIKEFQQSEKQGLQQHPKDGNISSVEGRLVTNVTQPEHVLIIPVQWFKKYQHSNGYTWSDHWYWIKVHLEDWKDAESFKETHFEAEWLVTLHAKCQA